MQNVEWIDMLRVLPLEHHNTIVLVLKNQSEIAVDIFFRFEPNFLVMRGRVAGTTDEGRAFFIPYDQMVYYRIERVVNLSELQTIFDSLPERTIAPDSESAAPVPAAAPAPETPPEPAAPQPTDAMTTRNALLDRIRAARSSPSGSGNR
jgi:hypothetical protein